MFTPVVPFDAAAPRPELALDAVPDALTQPEYVYLSRVVLTPTKQTYPKAKIPTVAFPAADPPYDAALAAVAEAFTHPEYVYLLRVVEEPKANMPTVEFPTADPY